MILEEETFKGYGYYPLDLMSHSNKRILAACDECGKVRKTSKYNYRSLCLSCAMKGKKRKAFTEEHKANISAAMTGKTHTEESKALISVTMKGNTNCLGLKATKEAREHLSAAHKGEKNPNWNGGKKISRARAHAKRRGLEHIPIYLVEEGEEEHHFTDKHVIGIPAEVHKRFSGYSRRKHRTLVLQWLKVNDKRKYKMVLCVLAKESLYMP